ncbi:MAG: hypothetical protein QM765_01265 [Myxococcales bacterium]
MRSSGRSLPLAAILVCTATLAACSSSSPPLCDRCPDVSGVYSTTRTLSGQTQCEGAPLPGAVRVLVAQNGSRVTFELEGAVLKGYLYEDGSSTAEGDGSRDGAPTKIDLSGSFAGDQAGGLRLRADVVETVTQGNPGRSCQVRAFLEGAR